MNCALPKVVAEENWGAASAYIKDIAFDGTFHCIAIAADSEAYGVELRIAGQDSLAKRIIVTRENPYYGPVPGRGTSVHPLAVCPVDSSINDLIHTQYSHNLKLLCYQTAPPWVSTRRAPARYDVEAGDATNSYVAAMHMPLIPVMGRDSIHVSYGFNIVGAANIDFFIHGGRVKGNLHDGRMKSRFRLPGAGHVDSWDTGADTIEWFELGTEAGISANAVYQYQYTGDYDFLRLYTVRNSGNYWAKFRVVAKDA